MQEALLVSNVLLWVAVLLLCAVVFALVRQLGVLHERVAPAGALVFGQGPRVGDAAPIVAASDLAGRPVLVGGVAPDGRSTLLFFLSPTCPVCKGLLPALDAIARSEAGSLRVLYASDGPVGEHTGFAEAQRLRPGEYLLSPTLGLTYQVGKLPYAVLLDEAGVLRAKGLVNSREHLESLFEAKTRGVASLQEWFETSSESREVAPR